MIRRITALAAGAILALGLTTAAVSTAGATTGTCTANPVPVSPEPVGCGGVYLPLLGGGIQPNSSSLTLTASSDFWNAQVTVTPYSSSDATQDFTVYEACDFTSPGPFNGGAPVAATHASPCGTNGTPVLNPDGFKEFVAEVTPDGHHLDATGLVNEPGNLCLSVEAVRDGPVRDGHRLIRWHVVLRTCDTFGAHFTAGSYQPATTGVAGVVNLANRFQLWSPIPGNGGYVLANNALSNNFLNHPFVLDARGGHGPQVLAFPENDQANQVWKVIGCTSPVTDLTPGFFACP